MANYSYKETQEYLNYYHKGGKLTFSQWLGHPYRKPPKLEKLKKKPMPKYAFMKPLSKKLETVRTKGVSQQALQAITEKELRKMKGK